MAEKQERNDIEIDLGLGKITFGGLFKGIGNLIDLASKASGGGMEGSGDIHGLPKGAKGVYGFSVRTMGGRPVIETFGNIRETTRGPVVEEVREPLVDVFDEPDHVKVIFELPGVAEGDIAVEVTGDILNLTASGRTRKYAREVMLPCRVRADSLVKSYKNGIMEITLDREPQSTGE